MTGKARSTQNQWYWEELTDRSAWQLDGNCVGIEDPEIFFPITDKGKSSKATIRRSKQVCHGCPVFDTCRANAPEYGTWAGETEWERKDRKHAEQLARRRKRAQEERAGRAGQDVSA